MRTTAIALCLASLAGCPTADDPPPAPVPTPEPSFQAAAHQKAFGELLGVAETALRTADPIAAAELGQGPLRATPVSADRLAEVTKTTKAAWQAADGISPDRLEADDAAVLRAIRFGLARARDRTLRRKPWRTDPGFYVRELDRLIGEVERRAITDDCLECAPALDDAAIELTAAVQGLAAASPAAIEGAIADLDRVARAAEPLPASGLRASIAQARTRFEAIRDALADAEDAGYADRLPVAHEPAQVRRLPDVLGAVELRRRLETDEDLATDAAKLFESVGRTLAKIAAVAEKHSAVAPGRATKISEASCTTAWAAIENYAARQPGLTPRLACPGLARWAQRSGPAPAAPAELTALLVYRGVVVPSRTARRRTIRSPLGLIAGAIAPRSHAHANAIAIASGMRDAGAQRIVLGAARDALCQTAAALWIHAELGDEAALGQKLEPHCGVDNAFARGAKLRPGAALSALGLVHLGTGPAHVAALEAYWWAPLGHIDRIAAPPPPAPEVKVQLEDLKGSRTDHSPSPHEVKVQLEDLKGGR